MPTSRPLPLLDPAAVRRPPRSFAWIDIRLRSDWLDCMEPPELGFYLFLALAADQHGLSCWRLDQVQRRMPCFDLHSLRKARDRLMRIKLLAYRPWSAHAIDGSYQLLALPAPSVVPPRHPRHGFEVQDRRGFGSERATGESRRHLQGHAGIFHGRSAAVN